MQAPDDEDTLLRSVAIRNAQSILAARQRAEDALYAAKFDLERKTEELALSLSMVHATLEASRDGILATDDTGRITGFNQQYLRMWRLESKLLDARDHGRVLETISTQFDNARAFMDRVDEIYHDAPAESFDLLCMRDGRIYERSSQIQFADGRNVGRVWVFRDITAQRRTEEALREETRVLELLNRTGAALASKLQVKALVQTVTDAATEISGARYGAFFYNTVDSKGKAFMLYTLSGARREDFEKFGNPRATAIFGPTFAGAPAVRIDDLYKDPRYGQFAPHYGMPPGHLPVRSYLAVPVASASGEVIGGLFFGHPDPGVFNERAERLVSSIAAQAGVAVDNARLYERAQQAAEEREQLLEKERAARGEAEQMSRMKDEFLAMLAHELRNPLAPLRNSLEVLRRAGTSEVALEGTRAIMERQLAHMTRLVDDLLDVSRISRGKLELRLERGKLADALRSAVETSRPVLAERRHQLRVHLPGDDVIVNADAVRLSQAFTNLLNNAAKYTPDGGVVELQASVDDVGATISVEDTGIGIPEHLQARIFDMFVQGEASPYTPKAQGGLGIGLTLVRKIIDMHGGSIRVEPGSAGRGSRFIVRLPRAGQASGSVTAPVAAPMAPVAPAAAAPTAFRTRRILVADDNTDAAATLAQLLTLMGHEVRTAGDGVEAVELAADFTPDLVILDIGMPRMDGYEACRNIRRLETEAARATIIALTGWGQPEDKQRAVDAGFSLHLTKPVDPGELELLIRSE